MNKRAIDTACRQFPSDGNRVERQPTQTLLPPDGRLIYMSFVRRRLALPVPSGRPSKDTDLKAVRLSERREDL
jgi:hypothetical protein